MNTEVSSEMPQYQSIKKVWALEIERFDPTLGFIFFTDKGYAPITPEPEMFARYTPVQGDFYVVYPDGYKSISPRKAFVDGYVRI